MEDFVMAYLNAEKKTFNPDTNYFNIDQIQYERELTPFEDELWDKREKCSSCGFWSIGLGMLIGMICLITFGSLMAISNWFVIGAIFGAACFVGGFMLAHCYFWTKEQDYAEEIREFRREHEEELWAEQLAEVRTYNEEQEKIAEVWRAEHPFEEHIRTCIKDPNSSVAIAVAAKYYAENYLNKEN
jgi:Na+/melibiose symporter-like transporter